MTPVSLLKRFVYAFLLAVLMAVAFALADAKAQTLKPSDVLIYVPPNSGICFTLEPWGYWFFFWGCHEQPPWNGQTLEGGK